MNIQKIRDIYPGKDVRRLDLAIGEKAYWGKGIGPVVVSLIVDFAVKEQDVDVLHCFAEDYNIRSCKLWQKSGFKMVLKEELKESLKGKHQLHFQLDKACYCHK